MKLSTGFMLAAPLMVEACKITFYQTDNWDELGRRYRVEIKASGVPDMWKALDDICKIYRSLTSGRADIQLPLCYGLPANNIAQADTSVVHGPSGLNIHNGLFDAIVAELQRNSNYGPNCHYEQHSTW